MTLAYYYNAPYYISDIALPGAIAGISTIAVRCSGVLISTRSFSASSSVAHNVSGDLTVQSQPGVSRRGLMDFFDRIPT